MAVDNQFKETVDALFKGMNGVVSSKTVVGDAIHIGDTIILPLVDVSFAIGAGAFHVDKKDRGAGGLGGKMIPSAVLVIQNGTTRLVNIKNQDTMTKILDMVPDVIDRFKSPSEDKMTEEDVADLLNEADSPENQNRRRFLAYIYCKRGKSRNEDETGIWFCTVFCGTGYGDHDVYSEHIYRNPDRSAVPPCRISAFLLLILKKYENLQGKL